MTVLDDRELMDWFGAGAPRVAGVNRSGHPAGSRCRSHRRRGPVRRGPVRPGMVRPGVAPLAYRGTGVCASRSAHTRRPVSTTVSIGLAAVAALITLWLGLLGHFSGDRVAAAAPVSDNLAVVQVQSGETLQELAARVAPGTPALQVVQRIRELNKLDSASVDAGQTLIAPVG